MVPVPYWCSCSVTKSYLTPGLQWTAARQAPLSFTVFSCLLELTSIELMMPSTISSTVVPFSFCPQSFPASVYFPMSQLFASGGQSIGTSTSASVLPMNIQGISFRIDWFDLLAVQGTLKSLLQHHSLKSINSSVLSLLYGPTLTSLHDS